VYLSILQIRIKQVYRAVSDLGLFRTLFVIALIIFLMMALYTYISQAAWSKWISAAYIFTLLLLHIKRPDYRFLKINAVNHHALLFLEYLLLSIPLLICQVYFRFFDLAGITILGLIVIPFVDISYKRKGLNNRLIKAIPDEAFEWKSGIRKYFLFVATAWLAGISTSGYIGSVPAVIIILGLVVINFYGSGEPLTILISPELSPKRFLFRKLLIAQTIISFMILPLVLAFIVFHSELWYIPLIEFLFISFILWYVIFLKYAFYQPNKQLVAGQLFTAIGAMSVFLPFLIPLTCALSVRFYFKSISNLNPYLDDFN